MAGQAADAGDDSRLPTGALRDAAVPWLEDARRQLAEARRDGRLPHAILVHGSPGLGQGGLAVWAAQYVLCESARAGPCGACASCVLFLAGNHPDFYSVELEEKASFIKVDQVRELCSRLGLRSYRGGWKVGIVNPADRMNSNSNNALLKTLEEPPEDTLLLLVASRIDRLPRTVVSRCQRIRLAAPEPRAALDWLEAQDRGPDWPALLPLAAGAPLRALQLAATGAGELAVEMSHATGGAGTSGFDPLALADLWSKDRPAERLAWLEHWLEGRIRRASGVSDGINNNREKSLPSDGPGPNITTSFELLDKVRDCRVLLDGSLNTLLLFEDLLVAFAEAFAGRRATRLESEG